MPMLTNRHARALAGLALALAAGVIPLSGAGQKFYPDDPIAREPETQDASKAQSRANILGYDLASNLFSKPGDPHRVRAANLNTIDEVPDSNWFTNRILARPLSADEVARGPVTGPGPVPGPMTVTRAKPSGITPGFVGRDSAGETWFVQFDAPGALEASSGASMVANKIFHALGYWQAENHIAEIRLEDLSIGDKALTDTPSGKVRKLDNDDLAKVFGRAGRQPNGAYRMLASRAVTGRAIEGFRYYGTRTDDPNDVVPHEHRRELRALKVFGAWTNLVDMKAGNTLDTVITENGRQVVRHYLQDVGSTFGTGALRPREWDEGYEYLYEGGATRNRLLSLGFYRRPWQSIPYTELPSIGRFEGDEFDPTTWRPRVPTAAFLHARPDDEFWAARRVMAFTDELIRAAVKAGQYSDPAAEKHLGDVLIKRRDKIGRAYLPAVNPVVNVALDNSGMLTFDNAAVDARAAAAPAGGYRAEWFAFDNAAGTSTRFGASAGMSTRIQAPAGMPAGENSFVRIDIVAVNPPNASWSQPVRSYEKRTGNRWKLVGFERLPDQ